MQLLINCRLKTIQTLQWLLEKLLRHPVAQSFSGKIMHEVRDHVSENQFKVDKVHLQIGMKSIIDYLKCAQICAREDLGQCALIGNLSMLRENQGYYHAHHFL